VPETRPSVAVLTRLRRELWSASAGMRALVLFCSAFLVLAACDRSPAEEREGTRARVSSYLHEGPGPYEGVPTTVYEDTVPSCATCEVRLVPVGGFGGIGDPELLRDTPSIQRDARGRFYATVSLAHEHEIFLFESDGSFVRTVGSIGEGPGEFRRYVSSLLVGPGDSLYVSHDGFLISVFDSSGVYARRIQLEHDISDASLGHVSSEGVLVKTGLGLDLARRTSGVHRYDHEGRHRGGIGPPGVFTLKPDSLRGPPQPSLRNFGVSPSVEGRIWLVENGNYRIEEIGPGGQVERILGVRNPLSWNAQLIMSVDEFVNAGPPPYPSSPRPPVRLRVRGITELTPELLAVVVSVAAEDWQSVELRRHDRYPDTHFASDAFQDMLRGVVDIIHVPTGAVLARTSVPGYTRMSMDGTFFRIRHTEMGVVEVEAFEIEIAGFEGF
jgi:hypothetical protein